MATANVKKPDSSYPAPPLRRLQIFSFDPAADVALETAGISRCIVEIPWEVVKPGPVGDYVEVVDLDPSSGCVYDPVDLMDGHLLASRGFSPSTGNPQFHQQMVYAVAMRTIHNFEQVLGRRIQWSERLINDENRYIVDPKLRYVDRLRIYPHALREQNAYYSPSKKALLFGYFNATTSDPRDELPGGVVFTCLSHDIVAHETTHAILDGLHRRLLDDTNPDMLAFHEAFADIVAIFQHFTLPGVLLDQIQRTRGDLRMDSLLVKLASQFARATGRGGALRNALGTRERPATDRSRTRLDSAARSVPTSAERSLSQPSSRRFCGSTRTASRTCDGSRRPAPASCRKATFIPIWPGDSPPKLPALRSMCSISAFVLWTTFRRSTSPSATF